MATPMTRAVSSFFTFTSLPLLDPVGYKGCYGPDTENKQPLNGVKPQNGVHAYLRFHQEASRYPATTAPTPAKIHTPTGTP